MILSCPEYLLEIRHLCVFHIVDIALYYTEHILHQFSHNPCISESIFNIRNVDAGIIIIPDDDGNIIPAWGLRVKIDLKIR